MDTMAAYQPFRDPARTFTPNGRPMRKPRRIAMRLSSISSRSDLEDYYVIERPRGKKWKDMTLHECMESRPPVKADLEGPTPCTYSVRLPLPTMLGGKINPRTKYKRDALPYPNTEVWTYNVNIKEMVKHCWKRMSSPNVFGGRCPVKREAPSYTMSERNFASPPKTGSKHPGPSSYNNAEAADATMRHFPAFTIACRKDGRKLASTPGPAHYHPNYSYCQRKSPAYSMRSTASGMRSAGGRKKTSTV